MPERARHACAQVTAFKNKGTNFLSGWRKKQNSTVWDLSVSGRIREKKQWTDLNSTIRGDFSGVLSREL